MSDNQAAAVAKITENLLGFTELDGSNLVEISSKYLSMQPGEQEDFIFTGFTSMQGERGEMKAISLLNKAGETYIAAGVQLVGCFSNIVSPSMVRILFEGKVKLPGGQSYNKYRVFSLQANLKNG